MTDAAGAGPLRWLHEVVQVNSDRTAVLALRLIPKQELTNRNPPRCDGAGSEQRMVIRWLDILAIIVRPEALDVPINHQVPHAMTAFAHSLETMELMRWGLRSERSKPHNRHDEVGVGIVNAIGQVVLPQNC